MGKRARRLRTLKKRFLLQASQMHASGDSHTPLHILEIQAIEDAHFTLHLEDALKAIDKERQHGG